MAPVRPAGSPEEDQRRLNDIENLYRTTKDNEGIIAGKVGFNMTGTSTTSTAMEKKAHYDRYIDIFEDMPRHGLTTTKEENSYSVTLMKDLLSVTGYIRGACSPIGMKKHFPTYIHVSCKDHDFVYVSAGIRGLQIKIAPDGLLSVSKGSYSYLIKE